MKKMRTILKVALTQLSIVATVLLFATGCNSRKMLFANSHDGFLNIRAEPSAKSAIVGRIYNGGPGVIDMGTMSGNWVMVNKNGVVGYIHSNYAQSTPTSPALISAKDVANGFWLGENVNGGHSLTLLFFNDGTYAEVEAYSHELVGAGRWEVAEGLMTFKPIYDFSKNTPNRVGKVTLPVVRENTQKCILNDEYGVVYKKYNFGALYYYDYRLSWTKAQHSGIKELINPYINR